MSKGVEISVGSAVIDVAEATKNRRARRTHDEEIEWRVFQHAIEHACAVDVRRKHVRNFVCAGQSRLSIGSAIGVGTKLTVTSRRAIQSRNPSGDERNSSGGISSNAPRLM
jgi:hypothetical protein